MPLMLPSRSNAADDLYMPLTCVCCSGSAGSAQQLPPKKDPQFDRHDQSRDPEECVRLEREVDSIRLRGTERREKFEEVQRYWNLRQEALKLEVLDFDLQLASKEQELDRFKFQGELEDPPPGPKCLLSLDTQAFQLFSCAVVIFNISLMGASLLNKDQFKHIVPPHCFFIFYLVELTLKAAVHQEKLLFGPFEKVCWNWVDVVVVLGGVVELCAADRHFVIKVGCFLVRLLRVFKVGHFVAEWDVSWAEGPRFQAIMMATIALNSVVIAMEDYFPRQLCFFWFDQVILVVFLFEIVVRLRWHGCRFFAPQCFGDLLWNWLDFTIVTGGVFDQWCRPLLVALRADEHDDRGTLGKFMMCLRLVRVMRILRLVRLIKKVKPLYTLVIGIAEAMQGMGWVVVLTAVWLYVGALLFVKLVGDGMVFGGEAPTQVQSTFPNVPTAMWVLFKVMNGDPGDLEYLFEAYPLFKLVIAIFMIISSWAILSILTAVVSENMIAATDKLTSTEHMEKEYSKAKSTRTQLETIFLDYDADNNGVLTETEFKELVNDELRAAELCEAANLSRECIKDLFQSFSISEIKDDDEQKVPCIKMNEFIDGLMHQDAVVTTHHLLRLEKRLTTVVRAEAREAYRDLSRVVNEVAHKIEDLGKEMVAASKTTATELLDRIGVAENHIHRDIDDIHRSVWNFGKRMQVLPLREPFKVKARTTKKSTSRNMQRFGREETNLEETKEVDTEGQPPDELYSSPMSEPQISPAADAAMKLCLKTLSESSRVDEDVAALPMCVEATASSESPRLIRKYRCTSTTTTSPEDTPSTAAHMLSEFTPTFPYENVTADGASGGSEDSRECPQRSIQRYSTAKEELTPCAERAIDTRTLVDASVGGDGQTRDFDVSNIIASESLENSSATPADAG